MTQQTDAALSQLRHLYQNIVNGGVRDTASAKRIADGLLSPAIAQLEKAVAGGEPVKRVFIVATGDEHEGEATYTRYDDAPPPLCDSECLYAAPPPQAVREPLPTFLALKFHARRDKKATVTLLFDGHESADAWVRGITKGGQHDPA